MKKTTEKISNTDTAILNFLFGFVVAMLFVCSLFALSGAEVFKKPALDDACAYAYGENATFYDYEFGTEEHIFCKKIEKPKFIEIKGITLINEGGNIK
jgi:hypothetical protein